MIKDLLLPMTGTGGDDDALSAALALAAHQNAHLVVLVIVEMPLPTVTDFGLVADPMYPAQFEAARERADALAARARVKLRESSVSSELRIERYFPLAAERTTALHALHADLAVLSRAPKSTDFASVEQVFLDLLMHSGRPVLVVPPERAFALPFKRVMIAWQPTPEARRAVQEAMPLMVGAESVDVLVIEPRLGELGHGAQPGADIATHLARHGLPVRVVVQPRLDGTTAMAILRHAREFDAELLVAGGYSHSRLRELILGGVTRELLRDAEQPILFSH